LLRIIACFLRHCPLKRYAAVKKLLPKRAE
jgi:hypothetical protein